MNDVDEPDGKTPRAISETTETEVLGVACMCTASHDTPTKRAMAIPPMIRSVRAAFLPAGARNALTPFDTASTPVSAAAPDANARRTTKIPTAPTPAAIGSGACACAQAPTAHLPTPVPTITNIATTKPYVGMANKIPDSRTPRRLTTVMIATNRSDSATLWLLSDGAADASATTPAVTETATVRT